MFTKVLTQKCTRIPFKAGMHNILPAKAFNLALRALIYVHFASFFKWCGKIEKN